MWLKLTNSSCFGTKAVWRLLGLLATVFSTASCSTLPTIYPLDHLPSEVEPSLEQIQRRSYEVGLPFSAEAGSVAIKVENYTLASQRIRTDIWVNDIGFTIDARARPPLYFETGNEFLATGQIKHGQIDYYALVPASSARWEWGPSKNTYLMLETDGRFRGFVATDAGVLKGEIVGHIEPTHFSNKTTQISKIIADGSINFEVSYDGRAGDNLKFLYKTLPVDSAALAVDKHLLVSTDTKEVELPHLVFKIQDYAQESVTLVVISESF